VLDFLGFPWILSSESSLFNRLHGIFCEKIFRSLFPLRGRLSTTEFTFGARKGGAAHRAKLNPNSDFLQSIVVDRAWTNRQQASPHFGCGAGEPPEVPGGGTTFGSCTMGAPFSMAGSTSFGWITPFDWFSFLLRFSAGAVDLASCAASGGAVGFGAWANAGPATSATQATNRLSRVPMIRMLLKRVGVRTVPWVGGVAKVAVKTMRRRHAHPHRSRLPGSGLDGAAALSADEL
jgi:hypothetical protein